MSEVTKQEPLRLGMTVLETAAALRMSRNATYEAIRRGDIPCVKIGGRYVVPLEALREKLMRDSQR